MTTEASRKTEHGSIPMALLRVAAQTNISQGSNWFVIPLATLGKVAGLTREDILQPFCTKSVVSEGGYTMLYNPENDSVHFTKIGQGSASSPAVEAQPAPIDAVQTIQKPDPSMSDERLRAIAIEEWATDQKLHREFTSQVAYVGFRVAEIRGQVHIIGSKRRVQ